MSTQGFWNMGGYAFYVWSAYGAGFVVLMWNLLSPRLRRASVLRELSDGDDDREAGR